MKNILVISIIILLSFFTVSMSSCTLYQKIPTAISFHKANEFNNSRIQRVLLVPFSFETTRGKVIKEITDAFFVEIQKSGKYDVVMPQEFQNALLHQRDIWNRGLIRTETIVDAKKRYNVDAIIFGTITQYNPYEPSILGVKVGMFSTYSGNIIWTADTIFDSSESSIIQLAKDYYNSNYQKEQSLYGWKILLISMKRYAQFVAHHVIATL